MVHCGPLKFLSISCIDVMIMQDLKNSLIFDIKGG